MLTSFGLHFGSTHTHQILRTALVHLHLRSSAPHQIKCCNSAGPTCSEGTLSLWQSDNLLFDAACEWLNKARSCSIFMTRVTGEGTTHTPLGPWQLVNATWPCSRGFHASSTMLTESRTNSAATKWSVAGPSFLATERNIKTSLSVCVDLKSQ